MNNPRKAVAFTIGILILVVAILGARWTGEKIQEKFLRPKLTAPVTAPATVSTESVENLLAKEIADQEKAATYATIPATGPTEISLALIGLSSLGGLSSLIISRRKS